MAKRAFQTVLWLALFIAPLAYADVSADSAPRPAQPPEVKPAPKSVVADVALRTDPSLKETHIGIPRALLAQMKGLQVIPARKGSSLSPRDTIVVGLAMTLSLTFGGLWLVRRKLSEAKLIAAALLCALIGGSLWSSAVLADAALEAPKPMPKLEYWATLKGVVIEPSDQDSITIVLTPGDAKKLQPVSPPENQSK